MQIELADILRNNAPLRNLHAGKRCFIVGNGPSLKTQDLTFLKDEITIVVSSFYRHEDAKLINPAYWVLADPQFWQNPAETFFPTVQLALDKWVNTRLFLPTGGFPFVSGVNCGPLIDLHFYHYDDRKGIEAPIDFTGGIPPFGQNVVIVCLMLAFFLGCNPIYFVGCDHDFMRTTKEEYENQEVAHFYGGSRKCVDFLNWEDWSRAMAMMDYQYRQLGEYARLWGFHLFNATRGGCLDHYPRVEYESLFVKGRGESPPPLCADPFRLRSAAQERLEGGDHAAALVLVEAAIAQNHNRIPQAAGLPYLKALCLTQLGRIAEALLWARQDYHCYPENRDNSGALIRRLELFLS